jgi:hypothetical protein
MRRGQQQHPRAGGGGHLIMASSGILGDMMATPAEKADRARGLIDQTWNQMVEGLAPYVTAELARQRDGGAVYTFDGEGELENALNAFAAAQGKKVDAATLTTIAKLVTNRNLVESALGVAGHE